MQLTAPIVLINILTVRTTGIAKIDLAEPTTADITAIVATQIIVAIVIIALTTVDIIIVIMVALQDMAIGATADATSLLKLLLLNIVSTVMV